MRLGVNHKRKARTHVRARLVCVVLLAAFGASAPSMGQTTGSPPRTSDGQPDLQGVWDFRTLTPLERPERYGNRAVLSEEEASAIEARSAEREARLGQPSDPERGPPTGGRVGAYNNFWMDQGAEVSPDRRTSLIVDPPNGRIPSLVAGAKHQVAGEDLPTDVPVRIRAAGIGAEGPENRGLSERCLQGFNTGPPITPRGYNQNIQILQTADHVVILNEMIHDARIVPLAERPPLPPSIRPWLGDSRGRWEGDTLVIETDSFTAKISSFSRDAYTAYGTGETLHLTERFSLVGADTLRYEFTVNDSATFTAPFTVVQFMRRSDGRIYEYACHEGNYGLRNILTSARALEAGESR